MLKPGTMVLILLIALSKAGEAGSYGWLIVLGLLFSIIGDIFLMLPSDRFVAGLTSFFLAHVVYILAFPAKWTFDALSVITGLILGGIALIYFMLIRSGVRAEGGTLLQIAVVLYITVISLMVYRAAFSGEISVLVGAVSFYLSDAILAWNRFVKRDPRGEYAVMITYFLAQTCIAVSVW